MLLFLQVLFSFPRTKRLRILRGRSFYRVWLWSPKKQLIFLFLFWQDPSHLWLKCIISYLALERYLRPHAQVWDSRTWVVALGLQGTGVPVLGCPGDCVPEWLQGTHLGLSDKIPLGIPFSPLFSLPPITQEESRFKTYLENAFTVALKNLLCN